MCSGISLAQSSSTRITKNYEFKKGVGIDSTIKSTETRILQAQYSSQQFNSYKDPSGTV